MIYSSWVCLNLKFQCFDDCFCSRGRLSVMFARSQSQFDLTLTDVNDVFGCKVTWESSLCLWRPWVKPQTTAFISQCCNKNMLHSRSNASHSQPACHFPWNVWGQPSIPLIVLPTAAHWFQVTLVASHVPTFCFWSVSLLHFLKKILQVTIHLQFEGSDKSLLFTSHTG